MASKLTLLQYIDLPHHPEGDFDHGDVSLANDYVFIANTAAGSVEVVDGQRLCHLLTIPDCLAYGVRDDDKVRRCKCSYQTS